MITQNQIELLRNSDCELCNLCKDSEADGKQLVCLMGKGNTESPIAFVGEALGKTEVVMEEPFVGDAGHLLNLAIQEAGYDRGQMFVTNAVKCRPKNNETPKSKHIKACRPYLEEELKLLKPKVICVLGNPAMESVLKIKGITKYRGEEIWSDEFQCNVYPVYHPAYVLRDNTHRDIFFNDIRNVLNKAFSKEEVKQEEKNYFVVKTIEEFRKAKKFLLKQELLAIDTETFLSDPLEGEILCFGFSWEEGSALTIPLCGQNMVPIWEPSEQREMREGLEEILYNVKAVYQNGKYDMEFLIMAGYNRNKLFEMWVGDSMLLHHVLNENANHGLDDLTLIYTDMGAYYNELESEKERILKELNKGKKNKILKENFTYDLFPEEILHRYQNFDADATFRVYKRLEEEVQKYPELKLLYERLTIPLAKVLTIMELNGVKVDLERLGVNIEKLTKRLVEVDAKLRENKKVKQVEDYFLKKATAELKEHYDSLKKKKMEWEEYQEKYIKPEDYSFNFSSQKQLGVLFYDALKLEEIINPKTGRPTLDRKALEMYADKHPFCNELLEYRNLQQFLSTFLIGIREKVGKDGRIHTNFLQHGTVCVTDDTILTTKEGLLSFKEILPENELDSGEFRKFNLRVLGKDGIDKSSHIFYGGIKNIIKLKTVLGLELEGTREHPLYVYNKKSKIETEKPLGKIQVGDFVRTSFGANCWGTRTKLERCKFVKHTTAKKEIVLPDRLTPELGRLLGYWVAEGDSKYDIKNGHYCIRISNQDKNVIEDIIYLSMSLFNIIPSVWYDGKIANISITSKEFTDWWIENFGRMHGAVNKEVPKIIRQTEWSIIKEFLRGLMGDACVGVYSKASKDNKHSNANKIAMVRYGGFSQKLMKQVHQLLINRGYKAILSYPKTYAKHKISRVGGLVPKRGGAVSIFQEDALNFLNEISPIIAYHQEGHNKITEFVDSIKKRIKKPDMHVITVGGITYVKVIEIESNGQKKVYDLTIPKNHTFTTNGLISHNTGRLSSRDPNLQNIPKRKKGDVDPMLVRESFIAEEGCKLVEADFAQLEWRIFADVGKDPLLMEDVRQGVDVHAKMAFRVYNVTKESPDYKDKRRLAKDVVFGTLYDESAWALARRLKIPQEEAEAIQKAFFEEYPDAFGCIDYYRDLAVQQGYVENYFGRRRRFPLLMLGYMEQRKKEWGECLRQAFNFRIQGTAGDLTSYAMIRLDKKIRKLEISAKMLIQIHDAVVWEVPDEYLNELCELIKVEMPKQVAGIEVPLGVEIEYGNRWSEMEPWGQLYWFYHDESESYHTDTRFDHYRHTGIDYESCIEIGKAKTPDDENEARELHKKLPENGNK